MFDKPNLDEAKIRACLQADYGISAAHLEFLPIGYDVSAWVYRVDAADGMRYFLKLRKAEVYPASLLIPYYLKEQGIEQVVAPLATLGGALRSSVEDFALILYPFIEAQNGAQAGLSEAQWVELGSVLRTIHAQALPPALLEQLPQETFALDQLWRGIMQQLQAEVPVTHYATPLEQECAALWREKYAEIQAVFLHVEELGRQLQSRSWSLVLCHADIHTANLLAEQDGRLFIVDWDQPVLSPKERDLMFIIEANIASPVLPHEEAAFLSGYGTTAVDWLALAFYRYAWAIYDLSGFGQLIFLMPDVSVETKQDAARRLPSLFQSGSLLELAHAAELRAHDQGV